MVERLLCHQIPELQKVGILGIQDTAGNISKINQIDEYSYKNHPLHCQFEQNSLKMLGGAEYFLNVPAWYIHYI